MNVLNADRAKKLLVWKPVSSAISGLTALKPKNNKTMKIQKYLDC